MATILSIQVSHEKVYTFRYFWCVPVPLCYLVYRSEGKWHAMPK